MTLKKLQSAANYLTEHFTDDNLDGSIFDLLDAMAQLASILADRAFLADHPSETKVTQELRTKIDSYRRNNTYYTFLSYGIN